MGETQTSDTAPRSTRGILLINLGTPDSTRVGDVRRYLRQFLMDPRVIDIAAPLRWLLVEAMILPFRSRRSAAAYRLIWTERGSPLRFHSDDLVEKLADLCGRPVALGMRYQNPSIAAGLAALKAQGAVSVDVLALYPQASASARDTAIVEAERQATRLDLPIDVKPVFFEHPGFIQAFADRIRTATETCGEASPGASAPCYYGGSFVKGVPDADGYLRI